MADAAATSFVRADFPTQVLTLLTDSIARVVVGERPNPFGYADSFLREATLSVQGPRLTNGRYRGPVLTVRDRRLAQPVSADIRLRYLFTTDLSAVVLGLFVTERPGTLFREDVVSHVRHTEMLLLTNYLIPSGFLRDRQGEAQDALAGLPKYHALRALFARRYLIGQLPEESRLVADLCELVGFLSRIAYDAAHFDDEDPLAEAGFHVQRASGRPTNLPSPPVSSAKERPPRVYKVWYGTTRQALLSTVGELINPQLSTGGPFTGDDAGVLTYGTCTVSIPASHKFGGSRPWWRRLILGGKKLELVAVDRFKSESAFVQSLKARLAELSETDRQILVYVHGYNVTFRDAAVRAAQLGADLHVPVSAFFSWPSKGEAHEYMADVASVEASEARLVEFLEAMMSAAGAKNVNLLVHSMGNRGLIRTLERLAAGTANRPPVRFGQIFLAAPDVDVRVFDRFAGLYGNIASRSTLYVSASDKALSLSSWLSSYRRAGYCPPVTVVPGTDTVEVTDIDLTLLGHGYYASAHAVLYDMSALLVGNVEPSKRIRLRAASRHDDERYWVIEP
jgi:esterase/lipase superfamily enzyme